MLVTDLAEIRDSNFTALKNGRPVVGLNFACIPNPILLTRSLKLASSEAGKVEPSKFEIVLIADVESGSSVVKLISPSAKPSVPFLMCNSARLKVFRSN